MASQGSYLESRNRCEAGGWLSHLGRSPIMKTNLPFGVATILLLFSTFNPQSAHAQGTTFTYQGRLNDGASPANGNYDLKFTLFGASSSGSALAGPITNSS